MLVKEFFSDASSCDESRQGHWSLAIHSGDSEHYRRGGQRLSHRIYIRFHPPSHLRTPEPWIYGRVLQQEPRGLQHDRRLVSSGLNEKF